MALAQWTDDQVFNQLDSGLRWPGSTITYAFASSSSAMFSAAGEGAGFGTLGASAQASARLALTLWDDLIAPDMQQVGGTTTYNSANIEFGMSSTVGYGYTYYPSIGSVWFSSNYSSGANGLVSPVMGRHGFYAYVHEIGHALGLDHPGNYDGVGSFQPSSYQDSTVYSIMSYFGPNWSAGSGLVAWADWVGADGVLYSPQTPMLSDVYAIQRMYGAETTTRVGDTVYGFNSNVSDVTAAVYNFSQNKNPILTIFDSAGNDTLDLSGWNTPSIINLAPGSFSSCNAMTNNIAIAFSCQIENAIGGGGNDTIYGNALNNRLVGGAGDDIIYALQGDDIIIGGLGNDTIDGGDGTDYVHLETSWNSMTWSMDRDSGYLIIAQGNYGTDKIKNVEFFRDSNNVVRSFSDLTGAPPVAAPYTASFSIAANSPGLNEGTGGSTAYRFTVTLSQASIVAQTVDWALAFGSGSGQADASDFSGPLSGRITVAAGQTTATVDVTVVGDSTVESDEIFAIVLSNPSNGLTLAGAGATGRIVNDDVEIVAPPSPPSPPPAPAPVPASSLTLTGSSASETLTGGTAGDKLFGMGGNDTLYGDAGNDLLDGGSGRDKMYGGAGDDIYVVDNSRDSVVEYANEGIDTIRTTSGSYTLPDNVERLEYISFSAFAGTGNGLDNTIVGGIGNDTLNGGDGNDTLIGGAGADRFVFSTPLGAGNIDFIQDFNPAQDKIVLDDFVFQALKGKGKSAGWEFHAGSTAQGPKDHILYDDHTGALYYDPDGNGGASAIHFATISTGLSLTESNFLVI